VTGVIGRVVGLHRYPVKSMAGENLASATVTGRGMLGDRAYGLVDAATGHVVSAKRPRKWPNLMDYGTEFLEPVSEVAPTPPVRISLPDGSTCSSANRADANRRLTESLGAAVSLESVAPQGASFEYHWPDMGGLVHEGRTYRDEVTQHDTPPGTFFDSSMIHVLTTASLAHLRELSPDSRFEQHRFRANIVVEPLEGVAGFVEDGWVGHTVQFGATVKIAITRRCIRCVMVNLPQRGLPADNGVLSAVFDRNEGHVGVKGTIVATGEVHVGDRVSLG